MHSKKYQKFPFQVSPTKNKDLTWKKIEFLPFQDKKKLLFDYSWINQKPDNLNSSMFKNYIFKEKIILIENIEQLFEFSPKSIGFPHFIQM